jgi:hypothetical protein
MTLKKIAQFAGLQHMQNGRLEFSTIFDECFDPNEW